MADLQPLADRRGLQSATSPDLILFAVSFLADPRPTPGLRRAGAESHLLHGSCALERAVKGDRPARTAENL